MSIKYNTVELILNSDGAQMVLLANRIELLRVSANR